MASTYDKASLVMIPSGTKASKIFSQKPVNGDGDFTFSRSTAATRVNASGNIEKETQNLLLQSNKFDTTWGNSNTTETGGQAGYDGSSDAWLLTSTAGGGAIGQSISSSGVQTFSVYAKSGTLNWMAFTISGLSPSQAYFDLQNGALGSSGSEIITSNIESVGGGWYRCSVLVNGAASGVNIYPANANNQVGVTGNIVIQDAQLEQGLVARDVLTTTTAAVEGGITDNVPRLDYTDSSCPALLLEPQRTNLLAHSEYLDGSGWNKTSGGTGSTPITTINTNETLSPESVYNATKIVFNSGSGTTTGDLSLIEGVVAISAGTDASTSIWLKGENGGEQLHMRGVSNGSFSIITLTTEWQQFTTSENSSTTTDSLQFGIRQNVSGLGIINSNATIYAFGAQIEEGSYATSYIPTYGTSVTRIKEICEVTSAEDLIGQTEGTIAGEFNYDSGEPTNRLFSITGADWNTIGSIRFDIISLKPQATIRANGGEPAKIIGTQDINVGTLVKFAVVYTSTTLKLFVNGAQIGSTATLTGSLPSTLDEIRINALGGGFVSDTQNNQLNPYKQALVFKTALTDQEAIDLTTI